MAVERVVACWVGLQHILVLCHTGTGNLAAAKYWDQREEQAYRLYDQSLRTLILVRTLLPSRPQNGQALVGPEPAMHEPPHHEELHLCYDGMGTGNRHAE